MEYVDTLFINYIIHDFKRVSIVVYTDKQVFIFVAIPNIVKYYIDDSPPNSGFRDAVLKSRRVEFNENFHLEDFTLKKREGKEQGM
uniref:Uncharacterized protein n=1 Tax=uncultured bacterium contig00032 TaxID=1181521 RepID=A0A806KF99_9BACT|nr:hypothetical protein [uncultured bacterium contig00032]